MNDGPALALEGIEKTFNAGRPNEVRVLRGATLSVAAGEMVALVAPSGAGKSTLLHIAGLLDTADRGRVVIGGVEVSGLGDRRRTAARRSEIGFVYQFHHLLPEFTALENVVLPQLAAGTTARQAADRGTALLERMGVGARAGHRPAELSGGEQQRTAICRALANAPRILLADEPTGNLDEDTADQVFEALGMAVRETGLAAIIATHNTALATRMDRIVRLEAGRLATVPGGPSRLIGRTREA